MVDIQIDLFVAALLSLQDWIPYHIRLPFRVSLNLYLGLLCCIELSIISPDISYLGGAMVSHYHDVDIPAYLNFEQNCLDAHGLYRLFYIFVDNHILFFCSNLTLSIW